MSDEGPHIVDLYTIELAHRKCKEALASGMDPFDVPFVKLLVELDCAVHATARVIDDEWAARRAANRTRLNRKALHHPISLEDLA